MLSVGNLFNPDVRYSFNIPIEDKPQQFFWDAYGPWQECSRLCQGEWEAGGDPWEQARQRDVKRAGEMGIVWTNLTAPCETYTFGTCSSYIER